MNTRKALLPKLPAAIALELSEHRQGLQVEGFTKVGEHKVRVTVYSDSYDFQCFARVHVWNAVGLSWNLVHAIQPSLMATDHGLRYQARRSVEDFRADVNTLLAKAREILL